MRIRTRCGYYIIRPFIFDKKRWGYRPLWYTGDMPWSISYETREDATIDAVGEGAVKEKWKMEP